MTYRASSVFLPLLEFLWSYICAWIYPLNNPFRLNLPLNNQVLKELRLRLCRNLKNEASTYAEINGKASALTGTARKVCGLNSIQVFLNHVQTLKKTSESLKKYLFIPFNTILHLCWPLLNHVLQYSKNIHMGKLIKY